MFDESTSQSKTFGYMNHIIRGVIEMTLFIPKPSIRKVVFRKQVMEDDSKFCHEIQRWRRGVTNKIDVFMNS